MSDREIEPTEKRKTDKVDKAPDKAPIAPTAMCDVPGCGMPAASSSDGLNHCAQDHHQAWTQTKHASQVRAGKGL